ncbi:fungal-specific transcription factor domain-containing protein [Infundibulicybe gibba]|nr:fungal-specific transcription factor domain-containing protein [Infundibulicybe gibba]
MLHLKPRHEPVNIPSLSPRPHMDIKPKAETQSTTFTMPTRTSPPFAFIHDTMEVGELSEKNEKAEVGQKHRVFGKSSGACVHCKSLKVRCEFSPGDTSCQRCLVGNYQCLPRSRKKRKPAPTHEDLQERAHAQDRQIEALLQQFDKLKSEQKVREWMSQTHEPICKAGSPSIDKPVHVDKLGWMLQDGSAEIAVISTFHSGKGRVTPAVPDIVKYCGLYPEDITGLFAIFFERINPFFSILDEDMHAPEKLIWTCPFLFTVICSIASRYYTARPELYRRAINFSCDAASRALVDGSKAVDICQAYLLMAVYPVPKKNWAEDRSWLLMGVAIRMAIELGLNQPPPASLPEREQLNRTRTWLNCYCADGSHAIQFGKIPMLHLDDYLARQSRTWYRSSRFNTPYDVHLCAYVHIILIMAEWRSSMRQCLADNMSSDILATAIQTEQRLSQEISIWVDVYAEEFTYMPLPICAYRGNTTQMIAAYLRLVVLAAGFQHADKASLFRGSEIVSKSMDAARTVIQIMVERLYPTGNLRFAMEANFLYVSFAAAFLINLLRPKLISLLDGNQQQEILLIVGRLINVLGSKEVALDDRHTPALYSRFLSSLLDKYHTKPSTVQGPHISTHNPDFLPAPGEGQFTPHLYSWPDIECQTPIESSGVFAYGTQCEPDMDFSLNHFVKTVTQDVPSQGPGTSLSTQSSLALWDDWESRVNHYSNWSSSRFPAGGR